MFTAIGYLPKRIVSPPEGLVLPGVAEIWSVSSCISKTPDDYIQQWRHNGLGLFGSADLARSVVPADSASEYTIVGYRCWHQRSHDDRTEPADLPRGEVNAEIGPMYRSLGFDVVSSSVGRCFECSPLSCNSAAQEFEANRYCLFDRLDVALEAATAFSTGGWEPGPYYVIEVLAPADRITSR